MLIRYSASFLRKTCLHQSVKNFSPLEFDRQPFSVDARRNRFSCDASRSNVLSILVEVVNRNDNLLLVLVHHNDSSHQLIIDVEAAHDYSLEKEIVFHFLKETFLIHCSFLLF